jgi:two-component system, LuxR family, sensor kinase FixL
MPWALPLAMQNGPIDGQVLFSALLVFTLGDMLGIVIVAPLLLWLARGADRSRVDVRVAARRLGGPMLALAAAGGLVWTMYQLGYGLQLAPILLATGWVGLRGGRAVAFPAILLTVAIVLSISAGADDDAVRVRTHLMLACIIASGYLAGSYADAQRLSAMEISRRDRLLYHAERLKTLRAMSIAVIHEVSQPLSTISLEANGLLAATESGSPDVGQIRQMAQMIAKKTAELSELVRRLRHYGERGGSDSSTLPASAIVGDVQELAQAEAQASRVRLECAAGPAVRVTCNEVEMQQALLNLLRNAIAAAASADRVVQLGWIASTEQVTFFVDNAVVARHPQPYGMGIGLMIVRGIARAHGGHLTVSQSEPGRVRHSLVIPIAKTP